MSIVAEEIALKVDGENWLYPFNLSLQSGSFSAVIGATRAGKTSLLRVLAGLTRPTHGRLLVNGEDVTGMSVRQRNVGMVYQEFVNYPDKTVFNNIAAPLSNAGESKEFIRQRVQDVAEMVGIANLLERFPLELSGGQQQRLSIARTIARPRQLVLLDEPLVNLDYKLREKLRSEFRRIFADTDAIVVYASSEPQEALILDGDVIVMHEGQLLQHGKAVEVYRHPASTAVAGQVSDPPMSVVPARLLTKEGQRIWFMNDVGIGYEQCQETELADGDYQLALHPHRLGVDTEKQGVTARINFVEVSGSYSFIYADYQGRPIAIKERGVHSYQLGEDIHLKVEPSDALLFDRNGQLVDGTRFERGQHG